MQLQEFASIRTGDARSRAGSTKVGRPFLAGRLEQTTFLDRTAAEVITIKIFAFKTGRSSHISLRISIFD
jgi:hypothetical protein